MDDVEIYVRPLDEILMAGKISVTFYPFKPGFENKWGQPVSKGVDQWWRAEMRSQNKYVEGQGETPRLAIVDLYKKL
jgi:hypothetical protein